MPFLDIHGYNMAILGQKYGKYRSEILVFKVRLEWSGGVLGEHSDFNAFNLLFKCHYSETVKIVHLFSTFELVF